MTPIEQLQEFDTVQKCHKEIKRLHELAFIYPFGNPPVPYAVEVIALRNRLRDAEEALRWYGDQKNWEPYGSCCGHAKGNGDCCDNPIPIIDADGDQGQRARDYFDKYRERNEKE